jgi:hypothetical protein
VGLKRSRPTDAAPYRRFGTPSNAYLRVGLWVRQALIWKIAIIQLVNNGLGVGWLRQSNYCTSQGAGRANEPDDQSDDRQGLPPSKVSGASRGYASGEQWQCRPVRPVQQMAAACRAIAAAKSWNRDWQLR